MNRKNPNELKQKPREGSRTLKAAFTWKSLLNPHELEFLWPQGREIKLQAHPGRM